MRLLTSLTCVAALAFGACVVEEGADATLEVRNDSSFTIRELYLTDVGNPTWGSNLLRGDVLFPNESFTLGVECGTYDAMLVDETNVQCELSNIDLCFDDAIWVIQNSTCSVFSARKAEAEKPGAAATGASVSELL
ncbi:MAG: hypothetical protein H0T79_02630 [Deltaproteobacteria bacterium]|nr:hypothetical protein [Deltaproteobacteria bacterium]